MTGQDSPMRHWTEDDAEVMAAAKALSVYYEGDEQEAESWIAGAVVALNATNYRGAVAALDALAAAVQDTLCDEEACGRCRVLRDALPPERGQ